MLNQSDFATYCKKSNLTPDAVKYLNGVRHEPPSRRVGDDARGNVCARIPTQSIAQTVQAESRSCEAIFVFKSELFDGVLEIWDQPTPLQLRRDKGAKGMHVSSYTPDFSVLRKDSPALIECKPQESLDKLIAQKPEDWSYIDGAPRFLPAYEAAKQIGLVHEIFVTDDTAPIYLNNLELLHALKLQGPVSGLDAQLARVKAKACDAPLTIFDLCGAVRGLEPSNVYRWLANGDLHGAFKAQLLSQEDVFRVFASAGDALDFEREVLKTLRVSPEMDDSDLAAILKASPKELSHAKRLHDKFEDVTSGRRKPTRNEYRFIKKFNDVIAAKGHTLAVFLPKFSDRGNTRPRLTDDQERIVTEEIKKSVKKGNHKSVSGLTGQINNECSKLGVRVIPAP